jgi:hypothetical protein
MPNNAKIAIIGSGNVGGTLGRRWAQSGHTVLFSSRHPESGQIKKLVADSGPTAGAAIVADAVRRSDVVLLATPWPATQAAVAEAGDLTGKILIDATNPLLPDLSCLEVGTTTSGAETVAGWARGARVVKAFNSIGANIMANPDMGGQPAVLFYCGDDEPAKRVVHDLGAQLGFDAEDAGPLTQARVLEPFALLWVSLAFTRGYGREFAFRIVRRG